MGAVPHAPACTPFRARHLQGSNLRRLYVLSQDSILPRDSLWLFYDDQRGYSSVSSDDIHGSPGEIKR